MNIKSIIAFLLICYVHVGFAQGVDPVQGEKEDKILISGYFEGTEPFWELTISDNQFVVHIVNDIVQDTLFLSRKQTHTATYAFQSKHTFGVVRESENGCVLDITEAGDPTHEIYFSYKGVTYMGCGKLTVKQE